MMTKAKHTHTRFGGGNRRSLSPPTCNPPPPPPSVRCTLSLFYVLCTCITHTREHGDEVLYVFTPLIYHLRLTIILLLEHGALHALLHLFQLRLAQNARVLGLGVARADVAAEAEDGDAAVRVADRQNRRVVREGEAGQGRLDQRRLLLLALLGARPPAAGAVVGGGGAVRLARARQGAVAVGADVGRLELLLLLLLEPGRVGHAVHVQGADGVVRRRLKVPDLDAAVARDGREEAGQER
mmetsp:Transcript_19800/g.60007  ORF Transcript_19800/g.60007 Transcript_19800/m.60007 type:complete len:240 (-) Transcript_19800:1344-2063(-)